MAKIQQHLRQFILQRAGFRCEYCFALAEFSPDSFQVDHIVPSSAGGDDSPENLALACGGCNGHKYNRIACKDPLTNKIAPLYHPRNDIWNEHFQWSADGLYILGLTHVGRATVNCLQINRTTNVNMRRLLLTSGLHPPKI
ncbi:MAG: HNH endonuclease [Saprospiraceae bacterium]|nr:HNH endonuclease [Saprospiraceae bacterium]